MVDEAETAVVAALIDGPRPKKDIPLPNDETLNAGRRLERRGFLTRDANNGWKLTKEGIMFGINELGVMPTPYNIYKDLPELPDEDLPSFSFDLSNQPAKAAKPQPTFSWVKWFGKWLLIALIAGLLEALIMQLSGYARVLW